MPELSLSKQALIELLERASTHPCEPYGDCEDDRDDPPVGGGAGGDDPFPPWELPRWLRLNPQPLPPRGHWRAANAARTIIAQVLNLHEVSEALASDGGERARGVIQSKVSEFVDDWCGTHTRPKPFPWPWGPIVRGTEELQPIELIVAGAQFQKAADALEGNAALQESFEGAADRLLQTGVSRLEETY
jgi:hypothetical protein